MRPIDRIDRTIAPERSAVIDIAIAANDDVVALGTYLGVRDFRR